MSSAGGLLAGVMANVRPGLFSAMVMKVCVRILYFYVAFVNERVKGKEGNDRCKTVKERRESGGLVFYTHLTTLAVSV